jgi:hypothetical protein
MERKKRSFPGRREGIDCDVQRIGAGTGIDESYDRCLTQENVSSFNFVERKDPKTLGFGVSNLDERAQRVRIPQGDRIKRFWMRLRCCWRRYDVSYRW